MNKDVFIADAHLLDAEDNNYKMFLCLLEDLRGNTRTLYLLGDIFEFWVGYKHAVFSAYIPVLEALYRLNREGTEIVFVEGNHDFHMGPYFENTLNCRVLPDGGEVTIGGKRVFIAHGDQVRTDDPGYPLLRGFLRSNFLRTLMGVFPPDWTWAIAQWASATSKKRRKGQCSNPTAPEGLLSTHAEKHFQQGRVAVITGHLHAPLHKKTAEGDIISLGGWLNQHSYAVLEDGEFTLKNYD